MTPGRAGSPTPGIGRISDRTSFEVLRRQGTRARRGPVAVTFLADGSEPPRVGFALPRDVGGAVARNRARRRLRAACRELRRRGALPSGSLLVRGGKTVVDMPFDRLTETLGAALEEAVR